MTDAARRGGLPAMPPDPGLYDRDHLAWLEQQAAHLRAGRLAALDVANLAEEIADLGRHEHDKLVSHLAILLQHLWKWERQPERRGAAWSATIAVQRRDAARLLRRAPSLRTPATLAEDLDDAWARGAAAAAGEMGLDVRRDPPPSVCPYAFDQALDPEFWPGPPDAP